MEYKKHFMKKYSVVIIGCGWIGMGSQLDPMRPKPSSHAEAVINNNELDLVAFVDNDNKALSYVNELYPEIPTFKTIEELFKSIKPDIAVIATIAELHCHYIKICSSNGLKLILSEKPISHNVEEAIEAVELCKKNSTMLLINHHRRFDKNINDVRKYINNYYVRDTAIGKVRSITSSYDSGLYHCGTHIIDLMRFMLGEVIEVSAIKNHQVEAQNGDINVDAIIKFKDFTAILYYVNSRECALCEMNILGERGVIALREMWGGRIEVIGTKTLPNFVNHQIPDYDNSKQIGEEYISGMIGTYNHVLECIKGKEKPLCSGEDALSTLKVLKAIEKSANSNGILIKL